jgi:hypothetical protein
MAIRDVVLRGYGNGTFNGTIPLVVTRGYGIGEEADIPQSKRFSVIGPSAERFSVTGPSQQRYEIQGPHS